MMKRKHLFNTALATPFFYIDEFDPAAPDIILNEETSKHIVQVLRMKPGEPVMLTNGKGALLGTEITSDHKKKCVVRVLSNKWRPPAEGRVSLAVSLVKNNNRFEWFLEKAAEIGVAGIIPLICERTEKQTFRRDRMQAILISAMLQSRQCWLTALQDPVSFRDIVSQSQHQQKYIAHCVDDENKKAVGVHGPLSDSRIVLIGPEGDFTNNEIEWAIRHQFIPVTLGATRLRTETAGIVAATLLNHIGT